MSPQDMEKLLGGYATDTLTGEERRMLFEAALGNQALFDALADEQALRELLQDPGAKARLLGVLREQKLSPMAWIAGWVRRPTVLALASAVAAGIVVIAVIGPQTGEKPRPAEIAMSQPQERAAQPVPAPSPAPVAPEPKLRVQQTRSGPKAKVRDMKEETTSPAPAVEPESVQAAKSREADSLQAAAPAVPQALSAASEPRKEAARKEPAKDTPQQNARDLYLAPQVANTLDDKASGGRKSTPVPEGRSFGTPLRSTPGKVARSLPGVQYTILKRSSDATFAVADPAGVFAPGDMLRLRLQANQPGTLVVMERDAAGKLNPRMSAQVRQGEWVDVPTDNAIEIRQPGEFHFVVRFTRSPQTGAREYAVTVPPAVVRQKVANAIYVVNPASTPDGSVEFEIAIPVK